MESIIGLFKSTKTKHQGPLHSNNAELQTSKRDAKGKGNRVMQASLAANLFSNE